MFFAFPLPNMSSGTAYLSNKQLPGFIYMYLPDTNSNNCLLKVSNGCCLPLSWQRKPTLTAWFSTLAAYFSHLSWSNAQTNLWPQIRICSHRFESMGKDCNLWPQIWICGNGLHSVGSYSNLWEQLVICGHIVLALPYKPVYNES